jgi:hypothetical protein
VTKTSLRWITSLFHASCSVMPSAALRTCVEMLW